MADEMGRMQIPGVVADEANDASFIAYHIPETPELSIVPASASRDWMRARSLTWSQRCLPMLIANESGWFVLNNTALFARWNGGDDPKSITFVFPHDGHLAIAASHFGYGILTWKIPYLFRTPSGFNLLVRGPANWLKDGITPLEGIVETDWAVQSFTMNWKFTRPGVVSFGVGEPIAMIVPQRRNDLERLRPEVREITTDPLLASQNAQFRESRAMALDEHPWEDHLRPDGGRYWQKNYFLGRYPDGTQAESHQLRVHLRPFTKPDDVADSNDEISD